MQVFGEQQKKEKYLRYLIKIGEPIYVQFKTRNEEYPMDLI